MGKLILYGIEPSAPVRTVLLTLNALDLEYEFKTVDVVNGENKSEEYEKKNPQRTVPTLEDDGQFISDSHAIAAYLVRKYGKNDDLYPKDYFKRAIVDQRLHFESGVLFAKMKDIAVPIFFKNAKSVPEDKANMLYEGLDFLEKFLENEYVAGDNLTIADFSIVSTVSTCEAMTPIDATRTPKVAAWLRRMTELPYYEKANGRGAALCTEMIRAKLSSE